MPSGVYGERAAQALTASLQASGGVLGAIESFGRSSAGVRTAVNALNSKGRFDAILIADSSRIAAQAGQGIKAGAHLLGTELWANDRTIGTNARLRGGWYAAAPDARFDQLVTRYRARYGKIPYRLGSLGYDAVLLTVRASRSWQGGGAFPQRVLTEREGFVGVDGIFVSDETASLNGLSKSGRLLPPAQRSCHPRRSPSRTNASFTVKKGSSSRWEANVMERSDHPFAIGVVAGLTFLQASIAAPRAGFSPIA